MVLMLETLCSMVYVILWQQVVYRDSRSAAEPDLSPFDMTSLDH